MNKSQKLALNICKVGVLETRFVDDICQGSDINHKVVVSDTDFEDLYFTPGTASFQESGKSMDPGDLFELNGSLFIPGAQFDNREFFDKLTYMRYLVKVTYTDGSNVLFGDLRNPVVAQCEYNHDRCGHWLKFKRQGNKCFLLD